jgi:hypothetical protein
VSASLLNLARLTCVTRTKGEEYTDKDHDLYEERYEEKVLWNQTRRIG